MQRGKYIIGDVIILEDYEKKCVDYLDSQLENIWSSVSITTDLGEIVIYRDGRVEYPDNLPETAKAFWKAMEELFPKEEKTMPTYVNPLVYKPCCKCKYMTYDSFHDETYCSHNPTPDGLALRALIGYYGSCEYWEQSETDE